jgi:multisubunit Na+/H+ antiporter MnhG subunit
MADETRTSWGLRLALVAVAIVVAWIVLGPVLSVARSILAIALYVVVAVVAYQVGKIAGRASSTPDD